ncbi:MAG TPA: PorV/PorQ family protein [Candidatus Kryptonia bacterium]
MRTTILAGLSVMFLAAGAFAQPGTAGFQILKLGYSARDLSLANSSDVLTKEPIAVFLNPAGLASAGDPQGIGLNILLTHRTYIAGTTIDLFGTRFEGGGFSFGTSLLLSTVPDIEVRNVVGDPAATFNAKDFAFAAGIAHSFDRFDVGMSATYLYEKLFIYESQGLAFNAGMKYSIADNIQIGVATGNIGSASQMISQRITLPLFLRAGGSYTTSLDANFALTAYAGVVTFKSGGITPSIGAELGYHDLIAFRAGYASGNDLMGFAVAGVTGFSFGGGVQYRFVKFDYSYVPIQQDFGNTQTFTLSFIL